MVQVITRIGLILMTPEAREERLMKLMDGAVIDAREVAHLIDECRDACYVLTEKDGITEEQRIQIRWMLTRIKGEEIVRRMDPDALAEWVVDLVKNRTAFSYEDLAVMAKALMGAR